MHSDFVMLWIMSRLLVYTWHSSFRVCTAFTKGFNRDHVICVTQWGDNIYYMRYQQFVISKINSLSLLSYILAPVKLLPLPGSTASHVEHSSLITLLWETPAFLILLYHHWPVQHLVFFISTEIVPNFHMTPESQEIYGSDCRPSNTLIQCIPLFTHPF